MKLSFQQDLSEILFSYLKKYKLNFYLNNKKISSKQVFTDYLPLFIYDKEIILKQFLQNINQLEKTYFHISFIINRDESSPLKIKYSLFHNFIHKTLILDTDDYRNDRAFYTKTLLYLAEEILKDARLIKEKKKIHLDNFLFDMIKYYKNNNIIIHTNEKTILDPNFSINKEYILDYFLLLEKELNDKKINSEIEDVLDDFFNNPELQDIFNILENDKK